MLDSQAVRLLSTFVDKPASYVHPADFTALLYLRDQGFVEVSIQGGRVMAQCTAHGREFAYGRSSYGRSTGK